MSKSYEEALAELDFVQTPEQFSALVDQLSVTAQGAVTVLYSGGYLFPKDDKEGFMSGTSIIAAMVENGDDVRVVDKSDAGRFLNSKRNPKLIGALTRIFNEPLVKGGKAQLFMNGHIINGKRQRDGIWDRVSEKFVRDTTGHVLTVTGAAALDRIFAQTELPALLETSGIESVDGIPIEFLRKLDNSSPRMNGVPLKVFNVLKAQSEYRAGRLLIAIDQSGAPLGNIDPPFVDTRLFFEDIPGLDGHSPSVESPMVSLAEFWNIQGIKDNREGIETLRQINADLTNAANIWLRMQDTLRHQQTLKQLKVLGAGAVVFDFVFAAQEAKILFDAGNSAKANRLLAEWFVKVSAGTLSAELTFMALAATAASGPFAALMVGMLTLLAASTGSELAGNGFNWLADHLLPWSDDFINRLKSGMDSLPIPPQPRIDPIILDLNGDGISTLSLTSGLRYFDHDASGFAERTSWMMPEDGLLVHDLNLDRNINTGRELFGNHTLRPDGSLASDGFAVLRDLDSNKDGRLNELDLAWRQLQVWKDSNGNTIVDPGELLKLSEAGVLFLNLNSTASTFVDSGENQHRLVGSFATLQGQERSMVDVWFAVDHARSAPLAELVIDPEIRSLPWLAGLGNVPDLHLAMAMDVSGQLQITVRQWIQSNSIERRALLDSLIFRWAGAEIVDRTKPYVYRTDARKFLAVERFLGQSIPPNAWSELSAQQLLGLYDLLRDQIDQRLSYQADLSPFFAALRLRWDSVRGRVELDERYLFDSLRALPQNSSSFPRPSMLHKRLKEFGFDFSSLDVSNQLTRWCLPLDYGNLSYIALVFADQWLRGSVLADYLQGAVNQAGFVEGLDGNDTLLGAGANDTLIGGTGNDLISGGPGTNLYLFSPGDGSDVLLLSRNFTGPVSDIIAFISGIQSTDLRLSIDSVFGDLLIQVGRGSDRILVKKYRSFIAACASNASVLTLMFSDGTEWHDHEILLRSFIGTAANDDLLGSCRADLLNGLEGDDTLSGMDGSDTLEGGLGNDILIGGSGLNYYVYSLGGGCDVIWNEALTRDDYNVIAFGPGIVDSMVSLSNDTDDLIVATDSEGNGLRVVGHFYNDCTHHRHLDEIRFADGRVWDLPAIMALALQGSDRPQVIHGYASDDLIHAAAGDDIVGGAAGNDQIFGDLGNDTLSGDWGDDTLDGGDGSDLLFGGPGANLIFGGDGDDHFVSGGLDSFDTMFGGDGIDRFLTSLASEWIDAGPGNDVIADYGGDDWFDGGAGDDYIKFGPGRDTISGGVGNDFYVFPAGSGLDLLLPDYDLSIRKQNLLQIPGIPWQALRLARIGSDLSVAIGNGQDRLLVCDFFRENTPYNPWNPVQVLRLDGSIPWSINVILAHVPGVILGGASADLLVGTPFDDLMLGQAGNDTLVACGGSDLMDGEAGVDLVSYADWRSPLMLNLSLQTPQDTLSAGRVTIRAVENLLAGSSADLLIGNLANNCLDGAAGDDTLDGGAGSDTLIGGANGPFGDTVTYAATAAAVTVNLAITVSQRTGSSGNDLLIGLEHLVGSSFNDTLTGDAQSNQIAGGAGNDVIRGGMGADSLSGGAGNDRFVFGTPAEAGLGLPGVGSTGMGSIGRDRITDFQLGDRIDLALIDANPTLIGNQVFSFIGLAPFSALGQVRALSSNGSVLLEGNCLGTLDPDFQIEIAGLTSLPATALIL